MSASAATLIRLASTVPWVVAGVCGGARVVHAHGFGQRYDLPLPLAIWVTGAGASIVVSFIVVASFRREAANSGTGGGRDLLSSPVIAMLASRPVVFALRAASAAIWLLTIVAGISGNQDPYRNITPTLIWVIGWVGISFASIFFGNVFLTFHPLRSLFEGLDTVVRRLSGRSLEISAPLPARVGVWPGLALFAGFAWLELVWSSADVPYALGRALALYSLVTFIGMMAFGRHRWIECAEFFSIAFGVLSRFAPLEMSPASERQPRVLRLRPPGVGLLEGLPLSSSHMLFIVLMLATVTFDGFQETGQWVAIADELSIASWTQSLLGTARTLGLSDNETLATLGFSTFPILFACALLLTAWFSRLAATGPGRARPTEVVGTIAMARSMVATLVPIAVAYHLAHYLSMLLVSGQYLIPLASDPMGFGWDLFGSASYRVDIGIVGVRFVWYFAATAIVLGHIVSVVLAHNLAQRELAARRAVIWSQIPLLMLMVGYTMVSLWILAQPIVE